MLGEMRRHDSGAGEGVREGRREMILSQVKMKMKRWRIKSYLLMLESLALRTSQ